MSVQESHVHVAPGEVCGACGRRVPIPREDKTPRKRGQVNISVPADAENGAEVLHELIEACREALAGTLAVDRDTPAYYILVPVLSDWLGKP